jgi:hypothetical protein
VEFDVLASEAAWVTTDVQEVGTNADFRATFARMAARLLVNMSRRHRARQRIERALAVVKAFPRRVGPPPTCWAPAPIPHRALRFEQREVPKGTPADRRQCLGRLHSP